MGGTGVHGVGTGAGPSFLKGSDTDNSVSGLYFVQ